MAVPLWQAGVVWQCLNVKYNYDRSAKPAVSTTKIYQALSCKDNLLWDINQSWTIPSICKISTGEELFFSALSSVGCQGHAT